MSRNRAFSVLSIVLVLAFVLAACAPAATPTPVLQPTQAQQATAVPEATQAPAPTEASAEPVELRITWWGSQARHDATIKVIELFEREHPNIKINYEYCGWGDYWTKLTTQASGGDLPDIMQQDYAYITEWTSRGLLVPLDDYVSSGVIDLSDASEGMTGGGLVDGKLMGVTLGATTQAWVIDVDAFEQAGVEIPAFDWTWDDFSTVATQLHEKLGIWGMGTGMWNEQLWGSLYLSADGWRYNSDGTAIGYTDDQPFIDYLKMCVSLQESGALLPRAEEVATYENKGVETRPIVAGKAAMDYISSNQIVAVWDAAGEDRNLKLVPLPRLVGGKSANYIKPSMFWSITSQSKHPKEAAEFIGFFTNSIEANKIMAAERGVPISSKVQDALKPDLGKSQLEMFNYTAEVAKDAQPIPPADPPGHSDLIKNVYMPQVMDPVAYGQLSPEDAAALLREQANEILSANK